MTTVVARGLEATMPATSVYESDELAREFLSAHHSIVVKPTDGAHGNGVTINITAEEQLATAIERARLTGSEGRVILQQQVSGNDYRVLVIDGEVVAVAERVPASVVGDGERTIAELIDEENRTNPSRGLNYEKVLNYIDIDAAHVFLGDRMTSVPEKDEVVPVVGTANMGTGGKAIDRTEVVPDAMKREAERIASSIGAFICGVDFIYDAATQTYFLIELNASPSFGLHHAPTEGAPINVAKLFVDKMLARYDQLLLTK